MAISSSPMHFPGKDISLSIDLQGAWVHRGTMGLDELRTNWRQTTIEQRPTILGGGHGALTKPTCSPGESDDLTATCLPEGMHHRSSIAGFLPRGAAPVLHICTGGEDQLQRVSALPAREGGACEDVSVRRCPASILSLHSPPLSAA